MERVLPNEDLPSRQSTGNLSNAPTNSLCLPCSLSNSTHAKGITSRSPAAVKTVIFSPVKESSLTNLLWTRVLVHPESTIISAGLPAILPLTLHDGNSVFSELRGVIQSRYPWEVGLRVLPQLNDMCPFLPHLKQVTSGLVFLALGDTGFCLRESCLLSGGGTSFFTFISFLCLKPCPLPNEAYLPATSGPFLACTCRFARFPSSSAVAGFCSFNQALSSGLTASRSLSITICSKIFSASPAAPATSIQRFKYLLVRFPH